MQAQGKRAKSSPRGNAGLAGGKIVIVSRPAIMNWEDKEAVDQGQASTRFFLADQTD